MSYTALYRKFRPKGFDEVKGQDQVVTVLKNQIKHDKIGHAYMFSGTRGTGKTSVAKIFAKAVNCENTVDGSPCGVCDTCKKIGEGRTLDVIEIDAATNNGVDNMREVIEEVKYSPTDTKYKVYIIDEVHMLSSGAFNALLKTLEEPPEYAIFILATTEPHKVLPTIKSRCQKYDFRRISVETISERLKELMDKEGNAYEEEALKFIARKGDGSMRDSLSLLDQCLSFSFDETLTYDKVLEVLGSVDTDLFNKLYIAIVRGDVPTCMDVAEEISMSGLDIGQFALDFTWYFRNLLLLRVSKSAAGRIEISSDKLAELKEVAKIGEENDLYRYIRIFSKLSSDIKYSTSKRAELEIALIKLCRPEMEEDRESLIARINKLETIIENGDFTALKKVELPSEAEEVVENEPEEAAKALPDDIKKIAASFGSISNAKEVVQPLRTVLNNARPYYQESGNLLVLAVNEPFDKEWLDKEESLELIKKLIAEKLHVSVEIKCKFEKEAKQVGDVRMTGFDKIAPGLLTYED